MKRGTTETRRCKHCNGPSLYYVSKGKGLGRWGQKNGNLMKRGTTETRRCKHCNGSSLYYVSKGTGWVGSEKWQFDKTRHDRNVTLQTLYYVSKETGWVGSEKWKFFLTFSTIHADVGWLGGSEKVQKCANVIQGWSLNSDTVRNMGFLRIY